MKKLLLVLFFTMLPVLAYGATYYAAPSGGSSCGNAQNPNTPIGGLGNGLKCLNGGDTLIVKSGTYQEGIYEQGVGFPTIPNGSPGNPTVVKSEAQYGAVLQPSNGQTSGSSIIKVFNGQNITVDGFTIDMSRMSCGSGTAVNVRGTSVGNVTIQNLEVKNLCGPNSMNGTGLVTSARMTPGASFSVKYANNKVHDLAYGFNENTQLLAMGFYLVGQNIIFEGNELWNIAAYCGEMWSAVTDEVGRLTNDNNIIRNNICHASGGFGMEIASGTNTLIYNNIVYNTGTNPNIGHAGIVIANVGWGTSNFQVYNNTVYQNTGPCISIEGATSTTVRNNICYKNGSDGVNNNGSGSVIDHNLLGIDPLFVNAAGGDFHLQSGSPAIDAGVVIPGLPLSFNGSTPDLGALESGAGGHLPAPRNLRLTAN